MTRGLITLILILASYVVQGQSADKKVIGTVYLDFVVLKTGEMSRFKVIKGINEDLDEVALNTVKGAPPWKPSPYGAVRFILPVIVEDSADQWLRDFHYWKKEHLELDLASKLSSSDHTRIVVEIQSLVFEKQKTLEIKNCLRLDKSSLDKNLPDPNLLIQTAMLKSEILTQILNAENRWYKNQNLKKLQKLTNIANQLKDQQLAHLLQVTNQGFDLEKLKKIYAQDLKRLQDME